MKRVHHEESERGEFSSYLARWATCDKSDGEWRYSKRDGSPAQIKLSSRWSDVTCLNCLHVHYNMKLGKGG